MCSTVYEEERDKQSVTTKWRSILIKLGHIQCPSEKKIQKFMNTAKRSK